MNANIREEYEASVLTNETIEVHLTYLRSGFDAVQAALPVLRDKIDLLSTKVDSRIEKTDAKIDVLNEKTNARIDAVHTSLSEKIDEANEQRAAGDAALSQKIDALNTSLSEKIDEANEQRAAGDAALGEKIDKANEQRAAGDAALSTKIDKLTERVLEVQGHQKAVLWVLSISSVVAAMVSIARTLDWI